MVENLIIGGLFAIMFWFIGSMMRSMRNLLDIISSQEDRLVEMRLSIKKLQSQ